MGSLKYCNNWSQPVKDAWNYWRKVQTWRENNHFPLDYFLNEEDIVEHNDVMRNYWLHTGLLLPNVEQKRYEFEFPPRSGTWLTGPVHRLIGNPVVFG